MKIALIIPPAWSIYMPPLGAAYISSALRKCGHQVDVFDYNVDILPQIHPDQNEMWERKHLNNWSVDNLFRENLKDRVMPLLWPRILAEIVKENYEVVAFSVYSTSTPTTRITCQRLRSIGFKGKIVLGGPSVVPELMGSWFEAGLIDAAVAGEGELPAQILMQRLQDKQQYEDIPGVLTVHNFRNPPPPKLMEMSTLVIPDFTDYNFEKYSEKSLPIQMSRGCTAACSFCSETYLFRSRPPEAIVEEFEIGYKKFGNTFFNVADSLINSSAKFTREVCELLVEKNMPIKWGGNARLDKFLTKDLLELMAKAGCHYLSFGLESGSNKVLKLMRKGIRAESAEVVLRDTHAAGIIANVNILVGFPGEEEEDFQDTIDFLERNKLYINGVSPGGTLGIGVGSHIHKKPAKYNVKLNDDSSIFYDEKLGWVTEDGRNTEPVRYERLRRLREFLYSNEMHI